MTLNNVMMQVVQRMFDSMDNLKEAYERIEVERNELNERWKMERENLRKTQKVCIHIHKPIVIW